MYTIEKQGDTLALLENGKPVCTPMRIPITTTSKPLAKRLLEDLQQYGNNPREAASVVSFHCAMLDFFQKNPRAELEQNIAKGLSFQMDWTLHCPGADPHFNMRWWSNFGAGRFQIERGIPWLSTLSLTQLCAVCVLGRTMESVNLAYNVATRFKPKELKSYAKRVLELCPFGYVHTPESLARCFDSFLFYFNLESKESAKKDRVKKENCGAKA